MFFLTEVVLDAWIHLHLPLGCVDVLSDLFQGFFRLLAVLNQGEVLLLQLSKDVQELLGIGEKQLGLLRNENKQHRKWKQNIKY